MNRQQAAELETRYVRWPWAGREETVTLSRWFWAYFDYLVALRKITPEALHREISAQYPNCKKIWGAIHVYIDRESDRAHAVKNKLANDNDRYHPNRREGRDLSMEERTYHRLNPKGPPVLPIIRWSPFKPIARAKLMSPESIPSRLK